MTKKELMEMTEDHPEGSLAYWGPPKYCCYCDSDDPAEAVIMLNGFAEDDARVLLCVECAQQMARMLMEDMCVYTKGGRHG